MFLWGIHYTNNAPAIVQYTATWPVTTFDNWKRDPVKYEVTSVRTWITVIARARYIHDGAARTHII